MPITVQTIATDSSLRAIEQVINQTEALGWELVSLASAQTGGNPANLAVFASSIAGTSVAAAVLREMDGDLSLGQQEAALNAEGKRLICYASTYVAGSRKNVAAFRTL